MGTEARRLWVDVCAGCTNERTLDTLTLSAFSGQTTRWPTIFVLIHRISRDKLTVAAVLWVALLAVVFVFADWIMPFDPARQDLAIHNRPPTLTPLDGAAFPHLLGTDPLGRDLLSRMIYGARISVSVAMASVICSGATGTVAGLLAGTVGGWIDAVIMRLVDLQLSLPTILLAMFLLYVLEPSGFTVILVFAITRWMLYARVVRGIILGLMEQPFVEAAIASGASPVRLMKLHLLPHAYRTLAALAAIELATVLVVVSSLSFLGLGTPASEPDWGVMLAQGRNYIAVAWWLTAFPGAAIMLSALSFNVLGAALESKLFTRV